MTHLSEQLIAKRDGNRTIWATPSAHDYFEDLEILKEKSAWKRDVQEVLRAFKTTAEICVWIPIFLVGFVVYSIYSTCIDVCEWWVSRKK